MEVAVQKRTQLINVVVEKAKKETEKLGKASQCRQEREQSIKDKHQNVLEKQKESQLKKEKMAQDTVQKVKAHTSKVATIAQSKKEKEAQSLKTREQELEDRLKSAQTRKETMTKKKIETA